MLDKKLILLIPDEKGGLRVAFVDEKGGWRADRIQSDLEELLKVLGDCCKKHDVQIKSAALIELPRG